MKSLQASKKMKKTKAGMIPVDWEVVRLEQLLSIQIKNGYSPNCVENPTGKYILGLGNLKENGLDLTNLKNVPENEKKVDAFLLEYGDFLISRSNTFEKVGRCALFKCSQVSCSYPDLMMRFRVDQTKVDLNYLEKLLQSPESQKYFQRHASGTSGSMVKINKGVVEKTPVVLPPLPEQEAIADLISTWDRTVEITERLIRAKERQFKWLLSILISKSDMDINKHGWKKIKLGNMCTVTKGKQLNVEHMNENGAYYALNGGIRPSGRTDDWNTEKNTITISEGGNSCGFVNFNQEEFWSGGHCYSILNLNNSIFRKYLYFFLKKFEPQLMNLRVGSGLPNIQKKDIDKFVIWFPSLEEQKKIAGILSIAQQEIDLLKFLIDKYQIQKRGLMQKLLTGKWRVKDEVLNHCEVN